MIFSNDNKLPEALLRAVQADPYDKGACDFSVTELLGPPRAAALKMKYKDQITEDASDRLYALYGQIVHLILERANRNDLSEKRYFGKIDNVTVSGQIDTLELLGGVLSDWKFVTSYKFRRGQATEPDWTAQLNMQLELIRTNGLDANRLQIVGLLRDHSKLEAKRDPDYPQSPVIVVPIEIWPREKTVGFMSERIKMHQAARAGDLPECTKTERWSRPDTFAVAKPEAKRAVRVWETRAEAEEFALTNKDYVVTERPGEDVRCQNYCLARPFCSQAKEAQEAKGEKK